MRAVILLILLIFTTVIAIGQKAITSIDDLGGMAGCWERSDKTKGLFVSEQWMKPAGTSILGMGRTVKNGKTTGFEFMRIEQNADGIFFIARPQENKEETAFRLIGSTINEVTFENKAHDFPQRVIYKLLGAKMIGRIEGNNNGKFLGIDYPMDKVRCS